MEDKSSKKLWMVILWKKGKDWNWWRKLPYDYSAIFHVLLVLIKTKPFMFQAFKFEYINLKNHHVFNLKKAQ